MVKFANDGRVEWYLRFVQSQDGVRLLFKVRMV